MVIPKDGFIASSRHTASGTLADKEAVAEGCLPQIYVRIRMDWPEFTSNVPTEVLRQDLEMRLMECHAVAVEELERRFKDEGEKSA